MQQKGSIFGATMLVAGTCIGGGMLALPVATGQAGFFPSFFLMLLGWGFMTLTALCLAEVNLWMKPGAHVITMASRFLGKPGKIAAWLLYLLIGFASLVAYTAGGGELLRAAIESFSGFDIGTIGSAAITVLIFAIVILLGNIVVGRVNSFLMIGLVLSYILLVVLGASHIEWRYLLRASWGNTLIAVPLLLTIFSFQTIVPSLTIYLKQDARALRRSIIFGTGIALAVYLIWEMLVLGTVLYDGDQGLAAALASGKPATEFFRAAVSNPWVGRLADFFAFFALITSFLGIGLGLFDFLADGLKINREKSGKWLLVCLIVIPTLFFALTLERVFLLALDVSGGIGDALLNGLMPALMLWIGRYRQNMVSEFRVPGGRALLMVLIAYGLFVFTIELLGKLGLVVSL